MKVSGSALFTVVWTVILLASNLGVGTTADYSTSSVRPYDPWCDLNDDGKIDIKDLAEVARRYGALGEPINKTALLLELQARLDVLNASVIELQGMLAILGTKVDTMEAGFDVLNASLVGLQSAVAALEARITMLEGDVAVLETTVGELEIDFAVLEAEIDALNATIVNLLSRIEALENQSGFTYAPAYDSGWIDITTKAGKYFTLVHNLNSSNIIVDMQGRKTIDGGTHQRHLGLTNNIPGWNQTYGGTDGELAFSMAQTSDGGYAIAGVTRSFGAGGQDFWLVKTDSSGNLQWNKTYGGTASDQAYSVVHTSDGGYALVGGTRSFGPSISTNFWLVKTDSAGNMQWNKTYGGTAFFGDMVQTSDGGYAITSTTADFDIWLVKTDSAGNMQWNKTYGGAENEYGHPVIETDDGGYALAGYTFSFGVDVCDFWLVKTDSLGNVQWSQTYGGTDGEWAYSVVQTSDGGYVLAGYTRSFGAGSTDIWLVKTDVGSGLAWTDSTAAKITLYRGATDYYWNYVRARIWKIKETP